MIASCTLLNSTMQENKINQNSFEFRNFGSLLAVGTKFGLVSFLPHQQQYS